MHIYVLFGYNLKKKILKVYIEAYIIQTNRVRKMKVKSISVREIKKGE